MKKIFLLFLIILSSIIAKAQGDYNYMPSGIGFDASTIRGYTNVAKQNNTLAFSIHYSYYPSPFLPITLELQKGRLWGGSRVTDEYSREYVNNYTGFLAHADLQMGEIVDYSERDFMNFIKNAYIGLGGGFVYSDVKNQRYDLFSQGYPAGSYRFPGKDKSLNPSVDIRIGYEIKFYNEYDEPQYRLHIEYTHHYVYGGGLDGYNDPSPHFANNYTNQYRQITIGLIYNFGLIRSYTKRIRDYYWK